WQDSRFLLFYFVQCLSYSAIAFLLALLIRRAGLAIGAFLIYMLGEQVFVGIFRNIYKETFVNYFPEEVTDQLIPQPYAKKLTQTADDVAQWEHHLPIYLSIALLYLIAYYIFTTWRFTKTDLR